MTARLWRWRAASSGAVAASSGVAAVSSGSRGVGASPDEDAEDVAQLKSPDMKGKLRDSESINDLSS